MGVTISRRPSPPREAEAPQVCPLCDSRGYTIVEASYGETSTPCKCRLFAIVKQQLGDIADAKPLGKPTPFVDKSTKLDLCRENAWIKGSWDDIARHAKQALALQVIAALPRVYAWRRVTDEHLRHAYYLKSDAYSAEGEPNEATFRDLIGADIQLAIIQLGFCGTSNKSLPGILYEALRIREIAGRPTWLVEDPSEPFKKGSSAWDEKLESYLQQRYLTVTVEPES